MTVDRSIPETLRELPLVAFDTETTGLWAASHRLVELAGVKFRPGSPEVEEFQELINPGRPIPEEVIRIHGIRDNMVVAAATAPDVLQRFRDFCGESSVLAAHNAPFDVSFLNWECHRHQLPPLGNFVIDSCTLARQTSPGHPSYSLLSLARDLGLADHQEHRALADARLVHQLILKTLPLLSEISSRERFLAQFATPIASFEIGETVVPDNFQELAEVCGSTRLVAIEYLKPGRPAQLRTVRPITIHRLNSSLYLNAFCTGVNDERTFRLDRIQSYRLLND